MKQYDNNYKISALIAIFEEAQHERAFPGGVVWLSNGQQVVAHEAIGTKDYNDTPSAPWAGPVQLHTIYDLASVSKTFTAAAFLIAARGACVQGETPVAQILPEFEVSDKSAITLRQLLNHSSGIEIAIQSFTRTPTIEGEASKRHQGIVSVDKWIKQIADAPLKTPPGEHVLYSCTNYFLLARVTEKLCGRRLDEFIDVMILQPLGMSRTTFAPLETFSPHEIAPAEIYEGQDEPWHGIVHDEAARTWQEETGGACGNAGVFSTAEDVSRFLRLWLDEGNYNGRQILHPEDVGLSFTDTIEEDDIRRGWCWQIDAYGYMSQAAPPGSAGHTGFTGPTIWLNPHTRHVAIILENRVYPTRNGPFRMPYHRRIAEWLMQAD